MSRHFFFLALLLSTVNGYGIEFTGEVRVMQSYEGDSTIVEAGNQYSPYVTFATGENAVDMIEKHNILSGDQIVYTVDDHGNYISGTFQKLPAPENKINEIWNGSIINITTTVYILEFCNWKPVITVDNITRLMFNRKDSQEDNIERYYDVCTYGKVRYVDDNVVVIGGIKVNCTGVSPSIFKNFTYDSSTKCGSPELAAWKNASETVGKQLAIKDPKLARIMNKNQRRILMILPNGVRCGWSGFGSVGCEGKSCDTYINGNAVYDNSVVFHELGHNIGLQHSGRGADEYGDQTDPMGDSGNPNSKKILCFAVGNMYKIGISSTISGGNLTSQDFSIEKNHKQVTIPATSFENKNFIAVDLSRYGNNTRIPYPKYLISYRVKRTEYGGYDRGLQNKYDKKITIHVYNGTQNTRDLNRTVFVDWGSPFQQTLSSWWTGPFINITGTTGTYGGGLRINIVSLGDTSAVVDICKMYSQKEVCFMNLDLDCDGLYGRQDTDCIGFE